MLTPDLHAWQARHVLGPALDAHVDPRGLCVFADIAEPTGSTYDEIVAQLESKDAATNDRDPDFARRVDEERDRELAQSEAMTARMLGAFQRGEPLFPEGSAEHDAIHALAAKLLGNRPT